MAKATETIVFKATPKECYEVITDYESYSEFLPETKEATVTKRSGGSAEVTFTLDLIKAITYTLKMVGKPPKSVKWSFLRGDLMKKNEGEWILEDNGDGTTTATYSIEVDLGLFVPGAITKKLIGTSLPTMLKAFKNRIENKKKKK